MQNLEWNKNGGFGVRIKLTIPLISITLIFVGISNRENMTYASQSTPQTEWIKLYSEDNGKDARPRLIQTDSNGYYLVGHSSFHRSKTEYESKLWVWKLDLEGNRIWSKPVVVPDVAENKKFVWDDLLCLENEGVIVVRESPSETGTWLIRFNEKGDTAFVKKMPLGEDPYVLRNIAKTKDGLLISGQKIDDNSDAWVLKVDFSGNKLWQKTYDKGQDEDAISMVVAEDGGFTLANDSGEYNKFGGGKSKIWIVKCDNMGNILAETLFPGRHPMLAMTSSGTYAVSYDIAEFPSSEVKVKGLDKKLNHLWETESLDKGFGLGMYKIVADSKDNFIIAGSKSGELWLWKIDEKGKQIWAILVNSQQSVTLVESMLVTDKECILASGATNITALVREKDNKTRKGEQRDLRDILVAKVKIN
jgi:hypothetical protein